MRATLAASSSPLRLLRPFAANIFVPQSTCPFALFPPFPFDISHSTENENGSELYLRERYYRPGSGTFTTLDSFAGNTQDPQSLHRSLYCHGDGVNFNDPTGMCEFSLGGMMAGISIGFTISYVDARISGKSMTDSLVQGLWGGALGGIFGGMAVPVFGALGRTSLTTQMTVLSIFTGLTAWSTECGVNDAIAEGNPDLATYRYSVGYLSLLMLPLAGRAGASESVVTRVGGRGKPTVMTISSARSFATEAEIASFEAELEASMVYPVIEGRIDPIHVRTPQHAFSQQFFAEMMRETPGAKRVGMGLPLSKFSGLRHNPDIRADVMVLRESGRIDLAEILSPGQQRRTLVLKLEMAWHQLRPEQRGGLWIFEAEGPSGQ